MNKENHIGIFDSGIGGVTVLKELLKLLSSSYNLQPVSAWKIGKYLKIWN